MFHSAATVKQGTDKLDGQFTTMDALISASIGASWMFPCHPTMPMKTSVFPINNQPTRASNANTPVFQNPGRSMRRRTEEMAHRMGTAGNKKDIPTAGAILKGSYWYARSSSEGLYRWKWREKPRYHGILKTRTDVQLYALTACVRLCGWPFIVSTYS